MKAKHKRMTKQQMLDELRLYYNDCLKREEKLKDELEKVKEKLTRAYNAALRVDRYYGFDSGDRHLVQLTVDPYVYASMDRDTRLRALEAFIASAFRMMVSKDFETLTGK